MRPTIKLGSHGPDVADWEKFLNLTADGIFGPATNRATITWQNSHGLKADGVVGPASWTASKLSDTASKGATVQARPEAKPADVNAYQVAQKAGTNLTEAERQYVLTVARGEGYYGRGWTPGNGAGSHNWGAVQGTGPAGSFQHLDHHADGTPYTTAFKAYNNDEEGFSDMARILFNGGKRGSVGAKEIKDAINNKKSLHDAVMAQHSNGYFELDPNKYLEAVLKNYNTLTSSGVVSKLLSEKGGNILGAIVGFLLLLGGGLLGYKVLKS